MWCSVRLNAALQTLITQIIREYMQSLLQPCRCCNGDHNLAVIVAVLLLLLLLLLLLCVNSSIHNRSMCSHTAPTGKDRQGSHSA